MKTDFWPSVFSGMSVEGFGVRNLRVGVDVVIHRTHAHVAGGQNQVGVVRGAHHVHRTQLVRLQFQRVDVDHDLPVLAAVGRRHRSAGNARDLIANLKLQIVVELRFVEPLAIDGQQANRKTRCVHLHHDRRQRAFRQAAQIGHRQIGNLRDVGIGVRARLKINFDQADAGHRTRFHVVDAAAQGKKSLERVGNVRFDLLRRHAVVKRGDQHDGNIDRRKHVHRHLHEAGDAEHADKKTNHDDEIWMSYRKSRHRYSIPGGFDELRRNQLAWLELSLLAEHHHFVFLSPERISTSVAVCRPSVTSRFSSVFWRIHHEHRAWPRAEDWTA